MEINGVKQMGLGEEEAKKFIQDVSSLDALRPKSMMAYETSGEGKLTEDDVIGFYAEMVKTRPSLVRNNLLYVGIRADLKQEPRSRDDDDIL